MKPFVRSLSLFALLFVLLLVLLRIVLSVFSAAPLSAQEEYETLKKRAGAVTIWVTPLVANYEKGYQFEIEMNTHSVALNHDMMTSAYLALPDSRTIAPESWNGDPAGGHHRSGVLNFALHDKKIEFFTLVLKDIEGRDLSFKWKGK